MDRFLLVLFVAVVQTAAADAWCGSSKSGQEKASTPDGERLLFFLNSRELWMVHNFLETPRTFYRSKSANAIKYCFNILSLATQMKGQLPYRRYYERICANARTPNILIG